MKIFNLDFDLNNPIFYILKVVQFWPFTLRLLRLLDQLENKFSKVMKFGFEIVCVQIMLDGVDCQSKYPIIESNVKEPRTYCS